MKGKSSIRLHNRVCLLGGFQFDESSFHVGVEQIQQRAYEFYGQEFMEIRSSTVVDLENCVKPNNKKWARDGEESGVQKEPENQQQPRELFYQHWVKICRAHRAILITMDLVMFSQFFEY